MFSRFVSIAMLCLLASPVLADDPVAKPDTTAAPAQSSPAADMQQVAVGDHWSYSMTDQISGQLKQQQTVTITEISPKDITARTEIEGQSKFGIIVYDTSWNILKNNAQRYSPNSGLGIQKPLAINKSWAIRSDRIDPNGTVWRLNGQSRVTGQESVSTKAGKFDVFVIETKYTTQNTNDPTRKTDATAVTWYSPALDHWVKRSNVFRVNGHVLQNYVVELTSYGRKKT